MSKVPFHYPSFTDRIKTRAAQSVFSWSVYGVVEECPLYVLEREARVSDAPHIYISAGIHGDEPTGTLAILRMLDQRLFSPKITWTIFPCLNPTGMTAGKRENFQGIDLNRDFGKEESTEVSHHVSWLKNRNIVDFDYGLFLHEDWEAQGAYLYSLGGDKELSKELISSFEKTVGVERAEEIDGHPAKGGIISDKESDAASAWEGRNDLPEAIFFEQEWSTRSYTIETPSTAYLADRVEAQVGAIELLAHYLVKE